VLLCHALFRQTIRTHTQVKEILDDSRLLGVALNSKKLGQRKNCNLPGVLVDLPVLGPKDVDDVKNFAAGHGMDFVAASFVQSADDVRFIRQVLHEAGGTNIKIISKIESWHGALWCVRCVSWSATQDSPGGGAGGCAHPAIAAPTACMSSRRGSMRRLTPVMPPSCVLLQG
jgi:hypothetical protein